MKLGKATGHGRVPVEVVIALEVLTETNGGINITLPKNRGATECEHHR